MNAVAESAHTTPNLTLLFMGMVVVLVAGHLLLFLWLKRYSEQQVAAQEDATEALPPRDKSRVRKWKPLFDTARTELEKTIASMPDEIRVEADRVPWTLQKWSDEGILGLFSGYEGDRLSEGGNIQLFLGDIYLYCAADMDDYRDELRTTYLHELGHHLGWDEDDLELRGLG